jgi:hypothetical protein
MPTERDPLEQQCCSLLRDGVTRCPHWGLPQGEFDFYTCEGCLNYLEECLEAVGREPYDRHANN